MNWRQEADEFKKGLVVETTQISSQAIRFGFFGPVGSGKTTTGIIFAIGITPVGPIGVIDGEGHRSGWALDTVIDMAIKEYGGTKQQWVDRFMVIHIDPPFNPLRVVAAIELLEDKGCKTVVADILSQCWDSEGGYLDLKDTEVNAMLEANRNTSEAKVAASAAARVKPKTHKKLVNKIDSSKCNIVMLFQARNKYNAAKFKPDDFETPIQESGLTRTAIAVGRVQPNDQGEGGYCYFQLPAGQGTKFTHASILAALPKNGQRFTFQHAASVLKLCSNATPAPRREDDPLKDLKQKLWSATAKVHNKEAGRKGELQQWLWDEAIIPLDKTIETLTAGELEAATIKATAKLATKTA